MRMKRPGLREVRNISPIMVHIIVLHPLRVFRTLSVQVELNIYWIDFDLLIDEEIATIKNRDSNLFEQIIDRLEVYSYLSVFQSQKLLFVAGVTAEGYDRVSANHYYKL